MSVAAGRTSFRVLTPPFLLLLSVVASSSSVVRPAVVAFRSGARLATSGHHGQRSEVAVTGTGTRVVAAPATAIGGDVESSSPSSAAIEKRKKRRTKEELREKGWFIEGENLCFYRRADGNWKRRRLLSELRIGQRLFATRLEGRDLLDGRTGPKIFFECGVGRLDRRGEWRIVNGMMRLGTGDGTGRGGRRGVAKKLKATALAKRLRRLGGGGDGGRRLVTVYVSDVDLASGRLEVTEKREDALAAAGEARDDGMKKIPASSLKVGTELIGTVVRVEPYGALVDVGANRLGLLHIKTVADLFGRYVNKQRGMAEIAGIEPRAKIRVRVMKNERRKMELDFTDDVRADVEAERMREAKEKESKREGGEVSEEKEEAEVVGSVADSDDDAAAWAAFAAADDYDYEEDDEYDEDQEIEDALGISTY